MPDLDTLAAEAAAHDARHRPRHQPTPAEIAAECARIRAERKVRGTEHRAIAPPRVHRLGVRLQRESVSAVLAGGH